MRPCTGSKGCSARSRRPGKPEGPPRGRPLNRPGKAAVGRFCLAADPRSRVLPQICDFRACPTARRAIAAAEQSVNILAHVVREADARTRELTLGRRRAAAQGGGGCRGSGRPPHGGGARDFRGELVPLQIGHERTPDPGSRELRRLYGCSLDWLYFGEEYHNAEPFKQRLAEARRAARLKRLSC
jgi:hypothetical protein